MATEEKIYKFIINPVTLTINEKNLLDKKLETGGKNAGMAAYPSPPSSSGDSLHSVYFPTAPTSNIVSISSPDQSYLQSQFLPTDIQMLNRKPSQTNNAPVLRFIEQPTNKFRFRYQSEMAGTHGSLCGFNSDRSRKQTYPTVELLNFYEKAVIRCSIYQFNVQKNSMPHPHQLIMKKGKVEFEDPHELPVGPGEGFVATFHSMGIIHTPRKNLISELVKKKSQLKKESIAASERMERNLTIEEYKEIKEVAVQESKSINLNIVCLRFDAFRINHGIRAPLCPPLFSHGIKNLKCALTGDLKIVRMDHCTSPVKGGKEIFLLVEQVNKKNIKIRFFEMDDEDQEIWEGWGRFSESDVHHQYAIVFKTPPYNRDLDLTGPVKVFMELVRPSDGSRSEAKLFRYVPDADFKIGNKRLRSDYDTSSSINSENISGSDIPATIPNNFYSTSHNLPTGNSWNQSDQLTVEQFNQALSDYNLDDYDYLFNNKFESQIITDDIVEPEILVNSIIKIDSGLKSVNLKASKEANRRTQNSSSIIRLEVSKTDIEKAKRTYNELRSFIKSDDASRRAPELLEHYLGEDNNGPRNNAIHVFISLNRHEELSFILKILLLSKKCELINVTNVYQLTPLHIAVQCHNKKIISYLLHCKADLTKVDGVGNTVLHTAIESMCSEDFLAKLLDLCQNMKAKKLIDTENYDGASPLICAIENRNMTALKLLCRFGADVNKKHHKNGFTPLRIAVENDFYDGVQCILNHSQLNIDIQNDFQEVTPYEAATNFSKEIQNAINTYMIEHGKPFQLRNDICEDVEKEEEYFEMDKQIQDQSECSEEVAANFEKYYKRLPKKIPSKYLNKIAFILDDEGKYQDLADLLDLKHLTLTGAINNSKSLLQYAVDVEDINILDIRNFLDVLGVHQSVAIMDQMAKELNHN